MNKQQNLLPSKFTAKYTVKFTLGVILRCSLPILILVLGMLIYSNYLESSIKTGTEQLETLADNKEKYEEAVTLVEKMQKAINENEGNLSYVKSIHGDYPKFDVLMTYLINVKPYNLAFISIEDFDIVPPPNMTSDVVTKQTVKDALEKGEDGLLEEGSAGEILSTADGTPTTEDTEPTDENNKDAEKPVDPGENIVEKDKKNENNPTSGAMAEYDATKYDKSLTYSRSIGESHILIRGYCTDIDAISEYVTSVASAPETEGYTLEGIEDKVTNIEDSNIILFEIKIKMKAVVKQ